MASMDKKYIVSSMSKEEVHLAIDWAKREGWNPGLHDAELFYRADPKGFFSGKLDGKIIAIGSAIIYDDQFAFCGFYMVDPNYRGRGYGLALTKERLKYIRSRNAGIDGVIPMLDKYERLGYQVAYNNARFYSEALGLPSSSDPSIISLTKVNFSQLIEYDQQHFPAYRDNFLKDWIHQEDSRGYAYLKQDKLLGYGVIRKCFTGYRIGPLFADSPSIAHELFKSLVHFTDGQPIYLDIPECNLDAVQLVKQYQLTEVFRTARMYLKNIPDIKMSHVYGITTFELG